MSATTILQDAETADFSHESVRMIVERMQWWAREEAARIERGFRISLTVDGELRAEREHARRAERLRRLLDVKNPDS